MSTNTPSLIGMAGDSLREAFGKALSALADRYTDFVVFDADIAGGTGVHHFRASHPHRFYQCGIAEQNMMAMAGGFSTVACPVFVTTFAVFCVRAVEQARLSIAYSGRNVKIVASHPGLDVGPDGASAQSLEDLAMFRAIPGMTVISPADPLEMAQAVEAIIQYEGPVYMRTGRSGCERVLESDYQFEIGKGKIVREGDAVTLVACGPILSEALKAAGLLAEKGVAARVVNMATLKPLDTALLARCSEETGCLVTVEDHNIHGGLGGAVAEALAGSSPCPVEFVGVKDVFGESGEPRELWEKYGLTAPHIVKAANKAISRKA